MTPSNLQQRSVMAHKVFSENVGKTWHEIVDVSVASVGYRAAHASAPMRSWSNCWSGMGDFWPADCGRRAALRALHRVRQFEVIKTVGRLSNCIACRRLAFFQTLRDRLDQRLRIPWLREEIMQASLAAARSTASVWACPDSMIVTTDAKTPSRCRWTGSPWGRARTRSADRLPLRGCVGAVERTFARGATSRQRALHGSVTCLPEVVLPKSGMR